MQTHGWTAQPATPPALTRTAALAEEPQVRLNLLGSSLREKEERRRQLRRCHELPVAQFGSSGPSSTTAPHRSCHQNRCGGITASGRVSVTVPWLCWDTAAMVQICHKPFSPRQPGTPGSPRNSDCTLHPSTACSQRGRARRSSYPISLAVSKEKEYKMLQNFPAAFSPCPSVIAIGSFLSLLLDASQRPVSLGI